MLGGSCGTGKPKLLANSSQLEAPLATRGEAARSTGFTGFGGTTGLETTGGSIDAGKSS
jgi:hypothetical protein